MKILITGADGMLGSSICREALIQGYSVRAFILPNRNMNTLNGLPIELFYGNLLDKISLEKAVEGCDVIINAAASTQIWPRRNALINEINFEAVLNLVLLAKKYKIHRFIQIGTANSFGHGTKNNPGNEQTDFMGNFYKMDYVDSKYKAQVWLLNEAKESKFPAIVINPTFMVGPYDSGPSSGKILLSLIQNQLPGYTSGMKNFVYSKDVAVATVNAIKLGELGNCYIAGNINLSFKEFFIEACKVQGKPFKLIKIPSFLIISIGLFSSVISRVTKRPPKLGFHMAKQSIMVQCYSASKAQNKLNMPSTPIREAIKSCIDWWKENEYL